MRINTPVSRNEYRVPPGRPLVSTTDLKGRILYCNPSFIEVSGYTREELLGQPHNLIRHPDMPEEAFRDMWATIESGEPWSAAVKNRRKDGDYYWVQANVTPLLDGGQVVGYMSVRTEISRQDIEAAERLYALMREEKARGQLVHFLQRGVLRQRNLAGWLQRWRPGLVGQMYAAVLLAGLAGVFIGHSMGTVWAVLAMLPIGMLPGMWVNQKAQKPLEQVRQFANRLAAGDLTARLEVNEPGLYRRCATSLNQLVVNLRAIVGDAHSGVQGLRQSADELANGSHDLSARTESQAANLEQTASSMEEITSTLRLSADAARGASQFAHSASEVTHNSAEAVKAVTATMRAINESSRRIGDIIQVIDGIAFQTNLLALNAAVEAARAGEQGRGFAVVAAEVRLLAQRTSEAAREIKHLIQDSAAKVEAGTQQVEAARHTMDDALHAVQRMRDLVGGIDTSASEQFLGITQVNQAVAHMDTLTQQNAALVEEMAAVASSVHAESEVVSEAIQVFKLGGAGAPGQAAPDAVSLRRQMKKAAAAPAPARPAARAA
ncbi:MAG: hypothetical protein RJA44_163 [Pseudomonadota bacterium]